MDYKDDTWLTEQIKKGLNALQIAEKCGANWLSVADRIIKCGLVKLDTYPMLDDRDLLRWCGMTRSKIPDDVSAATVPTDTKSTRVVVLGANGFVGRNLINYLEHNSNLYVLGWDRSVVDLMDRAKLDHMLSTISPHVVVDLAAFVGGIGLNKDNPAEMIYRNLVMSANVVDSCFTNGVRKLIYLGTVCSYPHTPRNIPFEESDIWYGRPEPTNEPYGVAKKTIGMMLDAYKRQYNFSSAYLIPTNMYGPEDDFSQVGSHVIPAMIKKFIEAKKKKEPEITHWGDGNATRDFLYVDDCCEAIRKAIETIDMPEPINIGSGYECSIGELSERICAAVSYRGNVKWDSTKPNGQPRRCLNTQRAYELLGFTSQTDLQIGLSTTIEWYKNQINKERTNA